MRMALSFKLLTLACLALAVLTGAAGCDESTDPSLVPPAAESPAPAPPAPATTAPTAGPTSSAPGASANPIDVSARTPAEHRKAAEAGDVGSMLLLGRSHESLGQAAEARKWYRRAADAGSEEGKQALAAIDAPPTRPAPPDGTSTVTTTAPAAFAGADPSSPSSTSRDDPTTRRVPVAPLPPGEPGKLRWIDLGAVLNYEDIVSDGRDIPASAVAGGGDPNGTVFIGRMTSRDAGIVVAAMGPTEKELTEVSVVIRLRNKVDPGSSPRVSQAGAIAARVTADNVNQREFLEWVTQYLQTEQRSEPIFRNGWRISVSGFAAEGHKDPKPLLGTAVIIEMKK